MGPQRLKGISIVLIFLLAGILYFGCASKEGKEILSQVLNDLDRTKMAGKTGEGADDSIKVGAFYYGWYDSDGRHWSEGITQKPSLGFYSSLNPDIISSHIHTAKAYGVDFFAVSWWGEGNFEDAALKKMIRNNAMKDFRFIVLYEAHGILQKTGTDIFIDKYGNTQKMIHDFQYLAKNYFHHPAYLKINGKPVVFLYQYAAFLGEIYSSMRTLRNAMNKEGIDLYIIGDLVTYWQESTWDLNIHRAKQVDAISTYTMYHPVQGIGNNFVKTVDDKFHSWKAMADSAGVDFIPDVQPGADDTNARPLAKHPVIIRTVNKFTNMCVMAKKYIPANGLIFITSWNEWHEGTQVEPAEEYGNAYLEVIKNTLR